jgi:hypothetical protein
MIRAVLTGSVACLALVFVLQSHVASGPLHHPEGFSATQRSHRDAESSLDFDTNFRTVKSGIRRRRLPGSDYSLDFDQFDSAEAGFLAGILFVVALVCLLICCCCGGCSLWDLVAIACLWEICCDRDGARAASMGDFVLV